MDSLNDLLASYRDAIDELLLEYLDDDDEPKLDAVQRMRFSTSALLAGSITPDHVVEDWPDWFQLAPALRGHLRHRGATGAGGSGKVP
jgi:hypothetical protein